MKTRILHLLSFVLVTLAAFPGACGAEISGAVAAAEGQADPDTDGDGLSDFHEIHKYRTDPKVKDTAGRGVPDGNWQQRPRVHLQRPGRHPGDAAAQPEGLAR